MNYNFFLYINELIHLMNQLVYYMNQLLSYNIQQLMEFAQFPELIHFYYSPWAGSIQSFGTRLDRSRV